jgi:hypothetical protein
MTNTNANIIRFETYEAYEAAHDAGVIIEWRKRMNKLAAEQGVEAYFWTEHGDGWTEHANAGRDGDHLGLVGVPADPLDDEDWYDEEWDRDQELDPTFLVALDYLKSE